MINNYFIVEDATDTDMIALVMHKVKAIYPHFKPEEFAKFAEGAAGMIVVGYNTDTVCAVADYPTTMEFLKIKGLNIPLMSRCAKIIVRGPLEVSKGLLSSKFRVTIEEEK